MIRTLLIIDVQQGLDDPQYRRRSNPEAEANMARLLTAWRAAGWPVVHVKHNSTSSVSLLRPELPGNAIKPEVAPRESEPVFEKSVHSAFIGTNLEAYLRAEAIEALVVVGLTTNHCVSTTVRMAANLGFEVAVVADATAAHEAVGYDGRRFSADEIHRTALASLHGEFATVQTTGDVLRGMATAVR